MDGHWDVSLFGRRFYVKGRRDYGYVDESTESPHRWRWIRRSGSGWSATLAEAMAKVERSRLPLRPNQSRPARAQIALLQGQPPAGKDR